MAKFTKRIQFGLTPWLWRRRREEAQQQKVSVNKLVRTALALGKHLEANWSGKGRGRQPEAKSREPSLLDTPVVLWSPAEKDLADQVIQKHFDEDR
jgi:hypothetical protein